RFRIIEVTACGGWPAEPEKAFGAIGNLLTGIVDDTNFVFRDGHAGRDKGDGRVFVVGRNGDSLRGKHFAIDTIDERATIERRNGYGESGFGVAADGKLGGSAETVRRKEFGETVSCFWIDGLGAIECGAPGAEVDAI